MREIKLLDCTLRDGGYINDWEFGHNNLVSVFERLVSANVEMIEIGFLNEHRMFDMNRSIMPDTDCVEKIYGGLDRKNTMVIGMIDYGTCGIEHIKPCKESFLDGIRVIFKKDKRKAAIDFCHQLKELGYMVCVQLVSITSYNDEELMDLIHMANELNPYAVSMVDTYGLLQQDNLMHYYELLEKYLDKNIGIGYHSHNNFQMAYANCVKLLSQDSERLLLLDASIYGMGKSAGNCPIELIALYLKNHFHKEYHISQMLEAMDANIMNIYRAKPWGYSMFFYIAASNNCHPNYVSYLMDKRTLSVKQMNEILAQLKEYGDKQLLYDKDLIEQLYMEYQKQIEIDDEKDLKALSEQLSGKKILILGPGQTIQKQADKIQVYIEKKQPVVIAINYIPEEFASDYIFLSNSKRYVQVATALSRRDERLKIIATSNVTCTDDRSFDYTLNIRQLLDEEAEIIDNSFVMLLKVLKKLEITDVALGGLDGYYANDQNRNYIDAKMEYTFDDGKADRLNQYVRKVLSGYKDDMDIQFITDSRYKDEKTV